jgi:hypothetical protein
MIGLRCIHCVRAHVVVVGVFVVGTDVRIILRALRYGTFDVPVENLPKRPSSQRPPINFQKPSQTHLAIFSLGTLPTQHFRNEIPINFSRHCVLAFVGRLILTCRLLVRLKCFTKESALSGYR